MIFYTLLVISGIFIGAALAYWALHAAIKAMVEVTRDREQLLLEFIEDGKVLPLPDASEEAASE